MACTDENTPVQIQIGMVSLGCPKNLADGESMLGLLKSGGYGITPDADLADLIIVNTCGFIDTAKKESINAILDMADKKVTGRCRALIVTGCLSERFRDTFYEELPEVDAALGVGEYWRICDIADRLAEKTGLAANSIPVPSPYDAGAGDRADMRADTADTAVQPSSAPDFAGTAFPVSRDKIRPVYECSAYERLAHLNAKRILTNRSGYVYIKISDGCDNKCSYCAIPYIRGGYIDRPRADIIAEAGRLSAEREIEAVLVAQDTTKYGAGAESACESGKRGGSAGLCGLIEDLSRLERVRWIRLMYAYPDRIDALLADQFAKNPKLVRYIDLPIQHAAGGILRKMGRRYGLSDLYDAIGILRQAVPDIVLRTTVMTGFPGESDSDFSELLDFITRVKFDRLGVFAYSREEGTPAASMEGQVSKKTALRRRSELLRRQSELSGRAELVRIGREYGAIIDAGPYIIKNGAIYYNVRTYAEAPEVDGCIRAYAAPDKPDNLTAVKPGGFAAVRITGKDSKGLFGELLT